MDITDAISVQNFFDANKIKTVIHCAALARMGICEADPAKAINVNVNGTSNIVSSILSSNKNCKMIYISTGSQIDVFKCLISVVILFQDLHRV